MKRFQPGWKITLFTAVLLPVVISLGFWQISRGAEKRAMEMDYLAQLTTLPVSVDELDAGARFQRVKLKGHFADEVFLVDNQIHQGQTGYWMVQVFEAYDGPRLLTNRGFIAAPTSRSKLPEISVPADDVALIGTVWPDTGLIPVLDDDVWPQGWPKRVQRLDVARMADMTGALSAEIIMERSVRAA